MHGLKNYNLVVEPWPGNPSPNGPRGRPGYRWRVTWRLQGEFYAEGFEDSHAKARAAAEAYLAKQGIEIMSLSRPVPRAPGEVSPEMSGEMSGEISGEMSGEAGTLPARQVSQRS